MKKNSLGTNLTPWARPANAGVALAALLAAIIPRAACAYNLYDGSNAGNNLEINLHATVSYTGIMRVGSPSATLLTNPNDVNGNDGDANLQHGLVSNLFEMVPILDIRDGDFGAHFSGQLYLNTTYLGTNQNDLPAYDNGAVFNAKNNDFTSATRNVDGENAQLLDAFVFGQHEFSDGQTLQLKVGRQTLFWGQSLFFPSDGISGGQAPINIITAQNSINPQAQQVFMPVGQAVITYQPGISGLTFQGYYQYEWEHDYFQGEGSFFNSADYIDKGASVIVAGADAPGAPGFDYLTRTKDLNPEPENGQFGLSVQGELDEYDWGLYGERFDSKAPEVYDAVGAGYGTPFEYGSKIGTYTVVYPRDIWLEGASLSTTIGPANVAGEISGREHMPLLPAGFGANGPTAFGGANGTGNANGNPLYPVGDVIDAQVSTLYVSPGIPLDPGGVQFDGEVVFNHLVSVTQSRAALRPYGQASAAAFDVSITPTYYDVLPSLELTFPIGLTYDFLGRSQVDQTLQHGTGTLDLGITATYQGTWIASLSYQDYLGAPSYAAANTTYNTLADRDFVSLNLQHSF
jgi:hypothetical protein